MKEEKSHHAARVVEREGVGLAMRIALWIASPPTCSVLTAARVADGDDRSVPRSVDAAQRRAPDFLDVLQEPCEVSRFAGENNAYLLLWRLDKLQYGALQWSSTI